jgi:hypothetical protein
MRKKSRPIDGVFTEQVQPYFHLSHNDQWSERALNGYDEGRTVTVA